MLNFNKTRVYIVISNVSTKNKVKQSVAYNLIEGKNVTIF